MRFDELVRIMVDADMELLSQRQPRRHLGNIAAVMIRLGAVTAPVVDPAGS